ncbi:hypothetical protein QAD02_011789 [Eretmocerus hayati]|uniref:Uncharacterized protein n=1 Tax=Eretmocerus hayati TaxID=131215 RepID=A0ACC2NYT2_9HYME|nr:hypothetical protein QAD02_011789 [Eretmocerus hayati]
MIPSIQGKDTVVKLENDEGANLGNDTVVKLENDEEANLENSTTLEICSGSKEPKKAIGRPKKRKGVYHGGRGRPKIQKGEPMSESTARKRARGEYNKLLEENDSLTVNWITHMLDKKKKAEEKLLGKPDDSHKKEESIDRHTKESALAFYLEYGFTRRTYSALVKDSIRRHGNKRNKQIYPCSQALIEAKKECLLPGIKKSEREVITSLQELANKTGERLCESVAHSWSKGALNNVKLVFSSGFDTLPGNFKSDGECGDPPNEDDKPQQCLFVTSIIPLQLVSESDNESDYLWNNSTPTSHRYCRPLRIAFEEKTPETILQEHKRMESQIKSLQRYRFTMANGEKVKIKYEFKLPVFDRKKFHRRHINGRERHLWKPSHILKIYNQAITESDPLISNILLSDRIKAKKETLPMVFKKYMNKSENDDDANETACSDEGDDCSDVSSDNESTSSGWDSLSDY